MSGNCTATALYVATELTCWETDQPQAWARDVGIDGTCYRRLDASFYAWLRSQVARAQRRRDDGRLAGDAFETIRLRFNAVHAWALAHIGEAALLAAVGRAVTGYQPPTHDDLETVRLGITDGPRRSR